jgi:hypothetical protein
MTNKQLNDLIKMANNEIKEWTKFLELVKKKQLEKKTKKRL